MAKNYKSNKDETVRLFKSNFLEFFTHIHPATPAVLYLPVIVVSFYFGSIGNNLGILSLSFLGGIFIWTLLEYIIHRFAFHTHPTSETGKKMHFLVHGIHHDYPNDSTRLVMPPIISIPLALIFFFLFK